MTMSLSQDPKVKSLTVLNGIKHGMSVGEYDLLKQQIIDGWAFISLEDGWVSIRRDYAKEPPKEALHMQLDD